MRSFIVTFVFTIVIGIAYKWMMDPPLKWADVPQVITVGLVLSLFFSLLTRPREKK